MIVGCQGNEFRFRALILEALRRTFADALIQISRKIRRKKSAARFLGARKSSQQTLRALAHSARARLGLAGPSVTLATDGPRPRRSPAAVIFLFFMSTWKSFVGSRSQRKAQCLIRHAPRA